MSFAGADNDLQGEQTGLDYSQYGAAQRTGATPLPAAEGLGATASGAFMGATRAISDYVDISAEAYRARQDQQFNVDPTADPGGALIDPKEWQTKYPDLGLTFTPDMGTAQAQLLVNHKTDELNRQYILDHSPDTFMAKSARTLTDFAVSATDPVNVAAAFVPGIGETRAGMVAARFGRTAARVAEGASAGATGMAALQPADALEAKAYQDHYGPMDAFMNVAFGTVLGGGLHAGAGWLSDVLGRAAPETIEGGLRASVAQAAEGRPVDVSPIMATDPALGEPPVGDPRFTAPVETPERDAGPLSDAPPTAPNSDQISQAASDIAQSSAVLPKDPSLFNAIRGLGGIKTRDGKGNLSSEGGDIADLLKDQTNNGVINNKRGMRPDDMRSALREQGWFGKREDQGADMQDLYDLVDREARGEKIYHPDSPTAAARQSKADMAQQLTEAGVSEADSPAEAARKLAGYRLSQADHEGSALAYWRQKADDLGVEYEATDTPEDVMAAVTEAKAVRPERDGGQADFADDAEARLREHENRLYPEEKDADLEQQFQDQAGYEPEISGASETGGGAVGQSQEEGGVPGDGQDAGIGRQSQASDPHAAIARARQNSIDFSRGDEPSTVAASKETQAHADAIIRAGDDPVTELADAQAQIEAYHAQGIITDDELKALQDASAAEDEAADTRSKAADAAARCLFLHP